MLRHDPAMCPHCGYDLRLDQPEYRDDTFMDPRGILIYQGKHLSGFSQGEFWLLWSIFKNRGRPISVDALVERLGSESENPSNMVEVLLCRARKVFDQEGLDWPISRMRPGKFRWGKVPTIGDYYGELPGVANDQDAAA